MTQLEEIIERIDEHLDPDKRKFKSYNGDMITGGIERPLECIDGTRIDIQASRLRACTPRNGDGPWTHVQICGFLNIPELDKYWNEPSKEYYQVPIELVAEVILQHGGIKDGI